MTCTAAACHAASAAQRKLITCHLPAVTHELRTPLNGVIGLTEGLLRESFGPLTDVMRRQLHVVRASGLRLLSMINGVLDSSAARIEKLAIRQDAVALREVAADVTQLLHVTVKQGVSIVNDVPGGCQVRGDADRCARAGGCCCAVAVWVGCRPGGGTLRQVAGACMLAYALLLPDGLRSSQSATLSAVTWHTC